MAVTAETTRPGDPVGRAASDTEPVIVDLGRKRRKLVKELRRGRGKLLDDVMRSIAELKETGAITGSAQPVIVLVRERPKSPPSLLW